MDRIRRNERMTAMMKLLSGTPNRIFTLNSFCELFGSAKSTMSEDVDLLQQVTYITRRERYTLALGLNIFRGSFNDDWSSIMCATCLSFIPGIVFYLIGQRYFVEGIVMTGMKN